MLEIVKQKIETLIEQGSSIDLVAYLNTLKNNDIVEFITELPQYSTNIIQILPIAKSVTVFKSLDLADQIVIIKTLPANKTAELMNELAPDDRTAFLEELPKAAIRELVKMMNPEERIITLSMLGYPNDSVGRLMTPDYVYVYPNNTVAEAFEIIRKFGKSSETIDIIYVIDENGGLIDDIGIKKLILADTNKTILEILDGHCISLHVNDDQNHAHQEFKNHNRVALPVVDDNNILLGIVTVDDILWVAHEEFSEDMQKIGGTESFSEPYLDISFFKLIRKRVSWLVFLFLGELLTATAMSRVENELEKAIVLSLFIPLILSSGGNSGSQASTLIIQAMSIGEVKIRDWWRVLRREVLSGLCLGAILGSIGFIRVVIWHYLNPSIIGDNYLLISYVVCFSLVGIVLFGTVVGCMLPIIIRKLGGDPAVSSAPFVATVVDVTGITIYFGLAKILLF